VTSTVSSIFTMYALTRFQPNSRYGFLFFFIMLFLLILSYSSWSNTHYSCKLISSVELVPTLVTAAGRFPMSSQPEGVSVEGLERLPGQMTAVPVYAHENPVDVAAALESGVLSGDGALRSRLEPSQAANSSSSQRSSSSSSNQSSGAEPDVHSSTGDVTQSSRGSFSAATLPETEATLPVYQQLHLFTHPVAFDGSSDDGAVPTYRVPPPRDSLIAVAVVSTSTTDADSSSLTHANTSPSSPMPNRNAMMADASPPRMSQVAPATAVSVTSE